MIKFDEQQQKYKNKSQQRFDYQNCFLLFPIQQLTTPMSRSQPYRSRIPTHIIQLLDVASRITLFLVGQTGPLSFTFKDRLENKYKASIGPEVRCSCSPQRNDHCIHTIYILLKVFKVSVENPIMWQAAYVDCQLQDLTAGKHTVSQARRPRPLFQIMNEQPLPELPSEQFRKKEFKMDIKPVILSQRMKLNEESMCPICQEEMRADNMCLSYCKVMCGNNFHLECLKVWAKHRSQQGASINCPMCRSKFPFNFLMELEQEEREYAQKQSDKIHVQFNCSGCGVQNIPKNPHKCLLCTNYELCQCCYASKKHIKHPFIRRDEDGRWRGAEERRQKQLKLKQFIHNKRKETYNDQILQKIRKIEEDPNKLMDYVASSYPYVSKYISQEIDPMRKMDFNPSDIKCFKCGATKMLFLRRLSCGHFVDHECLKNLIIKQKYFCESDGSQFLKGYENLKQKQKELNRKKDHQMLNIGREFDVSHIERQFGNSPIEREEQSYNFTVSSPEQPTLTQILTARESQVSHNPNRMRNGLTNNIIKEPRQIVNIQEQVRQRERDRSTRGPQIRIRNVGNSKQKASQQRQIINNVRQKSERKTKQLNMGLMIQALIGRKMK